MGHVVPNTNQVAAVARLPDRLDLFVTGKPDDHDRAGIFSASWFEGDPTWGMDAEWFQVGGDVHTVPAGNTVAALAPSPNQIDLFVTGNPDDDGHAGIFTARSNPDGSWSPNHDWFRIGRDVHTVPAGNTVTAVAPSSNSIDLFVVGNDGGIYTAAWNPTDGWEQHQGTWKRILPEDRAVPDTNTVAVVVRRPDQLDAFVVGHNGGIYSAWRGGWLLDDFTSGLDSFSVPPPGASATIVTRTQAGSMLGGVRTTTVYNALSPRGTPARLDIGGADRLKLTLDPDQYARLEVSFEPPATATGQGIDLHAGGADRISTTISNLEGGVINFNVVIFAAGGWSQAGVNAGAGRIDFRYADFGGPGGQDFRNVSKIVFVFQVTGSFTLNRLETGSPPGARDLAWSDWFRIGYHAFLVVHLKHLVAPGTLVGPLMIPFINFMNTGFNNLVQLLAQFEIRVFRGRTEDLSTHPALAHLLNVDIGECIGEIGPFFGTTAEQDELFSIRNDVREGDLVVYFVQATNPPKNGCATHPSGRPGAVVAQGASQWTLAHEVGHVLGLGHIDNNDRLMTGNGTDNIRNPPPDISLDEVEEILESEWARGCSPDRSGW